MTATPTTESTGIPGLVIVRAPRHEDHRGWFSETWHTSKLATLGLADLRPVQANLASSRRGVTRGLHAEPWDKYVTVAHGSVFGAWVDLREGPGFGTSVHRLLLPGTAVMIPRGVANAYQALADDTVVTYLVNAHWRPDVDYPGVNLGDPAIDIPWPIPLRDASVSDKDRQAPLLSELRPLNPRRTIVLGGAGQLGRALARQFPDAEVVDREQLDLTDEDAVESWPWRDFGLVLNAAAHTDVEAAETTEGRPSAWRLNAWLPGRLAHHAAQVGATLVHVSTDYVFDGRRPVHDESEPLSPLGVYGQSKAAGDLAVSSAPRHYLVRTSWLVGDGSNFVATMADLARRGASPEVVDDQRGRLTFADELARAIRHLTETDAPFGTYNVSASGPVLSWAEIAREVFRHCGRDPGDVTPVSTATYAAGRSVAPRPAHSALDLSKLEATGWRASDGLESLRRYLSMLTT